jgi:hypothetical protein
MNKDLIKIKYLIGTFRDSPEYPDFEDFYYFINLWYYHEGGSSFMHEYRGIESQGKVCFPSNILLEKLQGNEKIYKKFLKKLLDEKIIQVMKETRFTTYYEIINNKEFI